MAEAPIAAQSLLSTLVLLRLAAIDTLSFHFQRNDKMRETEIEIEFWTTARADSEQIHRHVVFLGKILSQC